MRKCYFSFGDVVLHRSGRAGKVIGAAGCFVKVAVFVREEIQLITGIEWHARQYSGFFKEQVLNVEDVTPLYRSISTELIYQGMEVRNFASIDALMEPLHVFQWRPGSLDVEVINRAGAVQRAFVKRLYVAARDPSFSVGEKVCLANGHEATILSFDRRGCAKIAPGRLHQTEVCRIGDMRRVKTDSRHPGSLFDFDPRIVLGGDGDVRPLQNLNCLLDV